MTILKTITSVISSLLATAFQKKPLQAWFQRMPTSYQSQITSFSCCLLRTSAVLSVNTSWKLFSKHRWNLYCRNLFQTENLEKDIKVITAKWERFAVKKDYCFRNLIRINGKT